MRLPEKLEFGAHKSPESGLCLMEAVAWFAREKHTDHPKCVAPTIAAFGRVLNDMMNDEERVQLLPFIQKMVGTAGDELLAESEQRRAFLCGDYAVRIFAPIALRASRLEDLAKSLEMLPTVVDRETARVAAAAANYAAAAANYANSANYAAAADSANYANSAAAAADSANYANSAAAAANYANYADSANYAAAAVDSANAANYADSAARSTARSEIIGKAVELFSRMM